MLRIEATWQKAEPATENSDVAKIDVDESTPQETTLPFFVSTKPVQSPNAGSTKRKLGKKSTSRSEASDSSSSDDDGETDGLLKQMVQSDDDLDDEEHNLESLVFGSSSCILSNIDKLANKKTAEKKRKTAENKLTRGEKEETSAVLDLASLTGELKPVWQDVDDKEM